MNEPTQTFSIPTTGDGNRSAAAVLEQIDRRLARLEAAARRMEALEERLPAVIAIATDTFDDVVERLRAEGIDVDERLRSVLQALERLTSPDAMRTLRMALDKLDVVQRLLESGFLTDRSVEVVGRAGSALAAARAEPPPELGLWGVAHAMSDEDVRRAVGFVFRVAQIFGRSLDGQASEPREPAGEPR
jgi:uncharacterized protein YjgD (DUF1641 family)